MSMYSRDGAMDQCQIRISALKYMDGMWLALRNTAAVGMSAALWRTLQRMRIRVPIA
jgi:hypothetical protein